MELLNRTIARGEHLHSVCLDFGQKFQKDVEVPNPGVGFDRSFRTSFLQRLKTHQSGDPSGGEQPPEFGWMALAGIAADGVTRFDVRSSLDADKRCGPDLGR